MSGNVRSGLLGSTPYETRGLDPVRGSVGKVHRLNWYKLEESSFDQVKLDADRHLGFCLGTSVAQACYSSRIAGS